VPIFYILPARAVSAHPFRR